MMGMVRFLIVGCGISRRPLNGMPSTPIEESHVLLRNIVLSGGDNLHRHQPSDEPSHRRPTDRPDWTQNDGAPLTAEGMPKAFFDDWVRVAKDEAAHFRDLNLLMADMDGTYGDLPAHDGLWDAARKPEEGLALLRRFLTWLIEGAKLT